MPALRQELERVPSEEVALDLRGVDHVDPVALGVVLAASVRAKRRGGRFAVVCADGRPRDLLAESGIDTIVEVYADPDELTRADT